MDNLKNILLLVLISVLGVSQLIGLEKSNSSQNDFVQQSSIDSLAKVFNQKIDRLERGIESLDSRLDNITGMRSAFSLDLNQIESKLDALDDKIDDVKGSSISITTNSISSLKSEIDDLKRESHKH